MNRLVPTFVQVKENGYFLVISILLSSMLGGCVSIAKSPDEMKSNNFARKEMCSQRDSQDVATYVQEKLERCREGSSSAGPLISNETWVETSELEDGTLRVSLVHKANWNKFHMQLVEVQETSDCPAHVVVYGMNDVSSWIENSEEIISWIEEWNAEC